MEGDKQDDDTENPTTLRRIRHKICRPKITILIKKVGSFLNSKGIQVLTSEFTKCCYDFQGCSIIRKKDLWGNM